ncbi:MAG: hypothetical protein KDD99_17435 [Bacteroidetes bacterium]|nr:hypothetical protein [Bacteroidota bacterium]
MKRLLLPILIYFFAFSLMKAQPGQLFDSEDILDIELTFDMKKFLADRSEEAPYQEAVMGWTENGEEKMMNVKIKVRGNYRRHATICSFPPTRLKIPKKKSKGTIFYKEGKLKLVPDCKGEEYVFREYLAYKAFNLFTDSSLQVRLIRVTYKDSARKESSIKQYGFLIEDEDVMAKRLGGEILEDTLIKPNQIQQNHLGLVAAFQYMIGNPDWNIEFCKNIKLVRIGPDSAPIPVPYDFDWSKAVDTPYAQESMGEGFERRKMPPICLSRKEYQAILDRFFSKRAEIESLYKKDTPLKKTLAKETLDYFEEFYEIISQPDIVEEIFKKSCPQDR